MRCSQIRGGGTPLCSAGALPVVLEGLGAEHSSTLLEHRAARGQVVLLEPVGRSQTRLSYC